MISRAVLFKGVLAGCLILGQSGIVHASNNCAIAINPEMAERMDAEEFAEELWKTILEQRGEYTDLEMMTALESVFDVAENNASTFLASEGNVGKSLSGAKTLEDSVKVSQQIMKNVERLKKAVTVDPTLGQKFLRMFRVGGEARVQKLTALVKNDQLVAQKTAAELKEEQHIYLETRGRLETHRMRLAELSNKVDHSKNKIIQSLAANEVPKEHLPAVRQVVLPTLEKSETSLLLLSRLAENAGSSIDLRATQVAQQLKDIDLLVKYTVPSAALAAGKTLDLSPAPLPEKYKPFRLGEYLSKKKEGMVQLYRKTPALAKIAIVGAGLIFNPVSYAYIEANHQESVRLQSEKLAAESVDREAKAQAMKALAERAEQEKLTRAPLIQAENKRLLEDVGPILRELREKSGMTAKDLEKIDALQLLIESPNYETRLEGLTNLSKYNFYYSYALMVSRVGDADVVVRKAAAEILAPRNLYDFSLPVVQKLAQSSNWEVRLEALKLREKIRNTDTQNDLLKGMIGETSSEVKDFIKNKMNNWTVYETAFPVLQEIYKSPNETDRLFAVQQLIRPSSQDTVTILAQWLATETSPPVIAAIKEALRVRK